MLASQNGEITFYEEFGVDQAASTEEIHDAFRSLVRLLHPDQQTDPLLKVIAEKQMVKMNRIYAVLSDPDRRRRYDETLEEDGFPPTIIVNAVAENPNVRLLIGRMAWIGAIVVSAVLLIWLASQNGSPFSGGRSRDQNTGLYDPTASFSAGSPRESGRPSSEIDQLRSRLRTLTVERDAAIRELTRLRGGSAPTFPGLTAPADSSAETTPAPPVTMTELPSATKPAPPAASAPPIVPAAPAAPAPQAHVSPAPAPAASPAPAARVPAVSAAPAVPSAPSRVSAPVPSVSPAPARIEPVVPRHLAGFWFYNKPASGQQNSNRALYPPEYIEATITEENGVLRGKYRSRFVIADRAISPDVNFSFSGAANGSTITCPWSGPGGARGEVTLTLMPNNSMRVDWTASEMGKQLGLASGTAILMRRIE